MKKIGRKKYKNYYFDFEKEEKWLNEMAKDGYVLDRIEKDYYIFEECNNGQYSYKIDILKDNMSDNEVEDYFSFLKELDINIVYSNKRWVYLREETGKGEFDLYSDKQSLIDYYNRYNFLRYLFGVLFFTQVVTYDSFSYPMLLFKIICAFISLSCLLSAFKIQKKIYKLKNEQNIHD